MLRLTKRIANPEDDCRARRRNAKYEIRIAKFEIRNSKYETRKSSLKACAGRVLGGLYSWERGNHLV
jgi:hypothetical protein